MTDTVLVIEKTDGVWPGQVIEVMAAHLSKAPIWWHLLTEDAQAEFRETARRLLDTLQVITAPKVSESK